MPLPINSTIQYACELIDVGKGIIPTLTEDNLLYNIKRQTSIGLQDVIQTNGALNQGNSVVINGAGALFIYASEGVTPNAHPTIYIDAATPSTSISPMTIGYTDNDINVLRGFDWYLNRTTFTDTMLSKGLEYGGNYEANFTARSLITKQYFDNNVPVVDGSETKINQGSNVTITGNGTTATPYIINAVLTQLTSGVTTTVTGTGVSGTPYVVETKNLQKAITSDYTLTANDNNYSIKVNNGSTPITITVPTGLPENFFIGITQKGTADITLSGASGVTLTNPVGLKIKGQGYYVGIEQIGSTNSFDVLANTKS